MNVQERLIIDNFFSIEHFDWEIKDFNILTGEMASGKSLCLKLLHFIEQIFHQNIFFAPISKNSLNKDVFYDNLSKQFDVIFHSNNQNDVFRNTKISYLYSYSDSEFDLIAEWNDNNKRLEWNSKYINKNIVKWQSFFGANNTPDAAKSARIEIHERIKHDFSSSLPIGAEFIPASRAIAAIANPSDIPDSFLENFIKEDKPFILNFNNAISDGHVNKILHLKKIIVNENNDNEKTIEAELSDGRKITPLELSSGQQELIYLLLLIRNLFHTRFIYGQTTSIFIEEPSAHLFPQEQKESIEYIVKVFRELQKNNENRVRFFISTHSPYILNVINNMLKKGYLIEKIDKCNDEILRETIKSKVKSLKFPHLMVAEISAYFIQKKVVSMINASENGAFLYEKMIENITKTIEDDYRKVRDLLLEIEETR
jgi:predicted ATPase